MLEYFIVDHFLEYHKTCTTDEETLELQERDRVKINEVDWELAKHFKRSAKAIALWADRKIEIEEVRRLADQAGNHSDVTDIRIGNGRSRVLNLSVKNRHKAVKHQRPASLLQHIGITKGAPEDRAFRSQLDEIYLEFHRQVERIHPQPTTFKQVEPLKFPYIYDPVCELVSNTLAPYGDDHGIPGHYQDFLLSKTDFYKVIVQSDHIEIQSFVEIPPSRAFTTSFKDNYVYVDFKNGIKADMRLHTASKRIERNLSLKFDSTLSKDVQIPTEILNL